MSKEQIQTYDVLIHGLRNVQIGFTFLAQDLETVGLDPASERGKNDIEAIKENLAKFERILMRIEDERSALKSATGNE